MLCIYAVSFDDDLGEEELFGGGSPRGAGARIDSLMAITETLEDAERDWSRNTQGAAARISRLHPSENANLTPELTILNAQIEVARRTCGWP